MCITGCLPSIKYVPKFFWVEEMVNSLFERNVFITHEVVVLRKNVQVTQCSAVDGANTDGEEL